NAGSTYAASLRAAASLFANRLNGNPFDNPDVFRDQAVGEDRDGGRRGYFSVIAPYGPDDPSGDNTTFRYGATDEAGKINLNGLLKADSSGTLPRQIPTNPRIPPETA